MCVLISLGCGRIRFDSIDVDGGTGMLVGGFSLQTADVDLTAAGTADWSHWGLVLETSFDHKASAGGVTMTATAPLTQYGNNVFNFTWSDGAPTAAVSNTYTGVFLQSMGGSIHITAPADTLPRTLQVFTDTFDSSATVTATVSDASAPPYTDSTFTGSLSPTVRVYTFAYQARSAAQSLDVMLTLDTLGPNGNLAVPAATLTSP